MLAVISPKETEGLLQQSGIQLPIRFYQAFMISGWYGIKSSV
jgi:tRNA (cmo5U34)-methyltransferase